MDKIGNGTMLVSCENCGKSLLSGQLMKHLLSRECREKGEKIRMKDEISDLRKKVERLEKKTKKKVK